MRLKETIEAYRRNDPAARSGWEVFWLYNGLHATMYYRVAHWLYEHRLRFLGRWVSQFARRRTGIEIHPAAKIGRRLVIDHGTGIVIGETTVIGDHVKLYQGVTLGAKSFELDEDDLCRWYSDGHDAFYITGSYTLHEDGLAYRQDGPVYAAGFDPVDYDPAEDWGENWMNNWG